MAVILQGLNRTAGAVGAASPKVLGAIAPKTSKPAAFSPLALGAACFSPLSTSAVALGDLQTATPKPWAKVVPSFLHRARASAAAKRESVEAARPFAEIAKYNVAR